MVVTTSPQPTNQIKKQALQTAKKETENKGTYQYLGTMKILTGNQIKPTSPWFGWEPGAKEVREHEIDGNE
jgi:hypothetical protein